MLYVIWTVFVAWSFFPNLADFRLYIIPIHIVVMALFALRINYFRNTFSIPGWFYFAAYGLSIVVSALASPIGQSNLTSALSGAGSWMLIPFVGIWLRERRYREYVLRLIIVGTILLAFYAIQYGDDVSVTRGIIGPWNFSLNSIATRLTFSFAILLVLASDSRRNRLERLAAFVAIALSFFVVGFVLPARTAIVVQIIIALMFIVYTTLTAPAGPRLIHTDRRLAISAVALVGILVLGLYQAYQTQSLPYAMTKRLDIFFVAGPYEDASITVRRALQEKGLEIFSQYPLTGIGWDGFNGHVTGIYETTYNRGGQIILQADGRNPHSIYITQLAELGLFGVVTFGLLILWLLRRSWRLLRQPETKNHFEVATVIWVPAYLLIGLTHDVGGMYLVLMMACLYGNIIELEWVPIVNWRFAPARDWRDTAQLAEPTTVDTQANPHRRPST